MDASDEGFDQYVSDAKTTWSKLLSSEMRGKVVREGVRIDGRATDEIRDIWIEMSIAPRAHGSTVFTRGETQGFVTATLGVASDAQRIDFAGQSGERRWMLQYSFHRIALVKFVEWVVLSVESLATESSRTVP